MKKFIDMLQRKIESTKQDSDFTFLHSLLEIGEAITKIVAILAVSSMENDENRNQYRILHGLVRTSGVGLWGMAIEEALSNKSVEAFNVYKSDMTYKAKSGEWQFEAVVLMVSALKEFCHVDDDKNNKKDFKLWFKYFSELRNKTRGHGASTSVMDKVSRAASSLEKSLELVIGNLKILGIECAYLYRNLGGKYKIIAVSEYVNSCNYSVYPKTALRDSNGFRS